MVPLVPIAVTQEVVAAATAVAEGGQFQQGQIESAAVERDELDAVMVGETAPELADDLPRPELRRVQAGQLEELVIRTQAGRADGDGDLKTDRQEVGADPR